MTEKICIHYFENYVQLFVPGKCIQSSYWYGAEDAGAGGAGDKVEKGELKTTQSWPRIRDRFMPFETEMTALTAHSNPRDGVRASSTEA